MSKNKPVTRKMQLKVIDGLCLAFWNSSENIKEAQKIISDIYTTTHINGCCKNPHWNWHKRCRNLYRSLKRSGLTGGLRKMFMDTKDLIYEKEKI